MPKFNLVNRLSITILDEEAIRLEIYFFFNRLFSFSVNKISILKRQLWLSHDAIDLEFV